MVAGAGVGGRVAVDHRVVLVVVSCVRPAPSMRSIEPSRIHSTIGDGRGPGRGRGRARRRSGPTGAALHHSSMRRRARRVRGATARSGRRLAGPVGAWRQHPSCGSWRLLDDGVGLDRAPVVTGDDDVHGDSTPVELLAGQPGELRRGREPQGRCGPWSAAGCGVGRRPVAALRAAGSGSCSRADRSPPGSARSTGTEIKSATTGGRSTTCSAATGRGGVDRDVADDGVVADDCPGRQQLGHRRLRCGGGRRARRRAPRRGRRMGRRRQLLQPPGAVVVGGLDQALERLLDRLVVERDADLDAELGGEEATDPAATDPVCGDT